MGRWGDGEMGRWGGREVGRWGDGEVGRWGDGEISQLWTRKIIADILAPLKFSYSKNLILRPITYNF